jgi:hypothetical protein
MAPELEPRLEEMSNRFGEEVLEGSLSGNSRNILPSRLVINTPPDKIACEYPAQRIIIQSHEPSRTEPMIVFPPCLPVVCC